MNLKWEPFEQLEKIHKEDIVPVLSTTKAGWDLSMDVYEEKDHVIVELNLPGVDPHDLEFSVNGEFLKIFGRRKPKEEYRKNYSAREIKRGTFVRMIRLPKRVSRRRAETTYKHGTIKLILRKEKIKQEVH
jgi:HSP20 family protein